MLIEKFRQISIAAVIASIALISACGGGGGGGAAGTATQPSTVLASNIGINMSTTRGLLVAPSGTVTAQAGFLERLFNIIGVASAFAQTSQQKLFSLNADNSITEVIITSTITTDQTGKTTTTRSTTSLNTTVNGLYNTKNWIFINVSPLIYKSDGTLCGAVMVRKSDGSLYCLPIFVQPGAVDPDGRSLKTDSTGNIVYIEGTLLPSQSGLWQVNLNDPANYTFQYFSEDAQNYNFQVNGSGDVLLPTSTNLKIVKVNGAFQNIAAGSFGYSCLLGGPGSDADSFYYSIISGGGFDGYIKLIKSNPSFVSSNYYNFNSGGIGWISCNIGAPAVYQSNKIYVLDSNSIVELVNSAGIPVRIASPSTAILGRMYGFVGGLVVTGTTASGDPALLRIDSSNNSLTTIAGLTGYSISSVGVAPTGAITFSGVRGSDGANVIGSVDALSNSAVIIKSDLQNTVNQIAALN